MSAYFLFIHRKKILKGYYLKARLLIQPMNYLLTRDLNKVNNKFNDENEKRIIKTFVSGLKFSIIKVSKQSLRFYIGGYYIKDTIYYVQYCSVN